MIAFDQEQTLRTEAASAVEVITKRTSLFKGNTTQITPKFDTSECLIGKDIGAGGFSIVYEVDAMDLFDDPKNRDHSQARKLIADSTKRQGQTRYALKRLKRSTLRKANSPKENDTNSFVAGVVDLAMEVKFLSVLNHHNIIKLRGISSVHPCADDFFLILDRLQNTLEERIYLWKKSSRRVKGFLGFVLDSKGKKKAKIFMNGISAAYGICSALEYLHSKRIVFRDLKPENIGFDVRDDIKLFDFGLAREIEEDSEGKGRKNSVYVMSNEVGSRRYLAPEVAFCKPYNHKVDVYAFGLILWQLLELKTPFAAFLAQVDFDRFVFHENNRPKIREKIFSSSPALPLLLRRCWSVNIAERPEFIEIKNILKEEIDAYDESLVCELDISDKSRISNQ